MNYQGRRYFIEIYARNPLLADYLKAFYETLVNLNTQQFKKEYGTHGTFEMTIPGYKVEIPFSVSGEVCWFEDLIIKPKK